MKTTETITRQLLAAAGDGWTIEPAGVGVIRPIEWTDPRFVPNITVLTVSGPPGLHVPSTAVQLAGSLDEPEPVVLHQVLVDDYDGMAVTHETVWLRGENETYVSVTSSACGHDVAGAAQLMRAWQLDIRGKDDR